MLKSDEWRDRAAGPLLVVFFFSLYVLTAQRGVSWGDSGLFQYRFLTGDTVGFAGLAAAHPLSILTGSALAHFIPTSCRFWAFNALSGFWAALTLGIFYRTARLFGAAVRGALLAALTLGLSHMMWTLATMAEVYTQSLFFLSLETFFALTFVRTRRAVWMLPLALANGLHFSVHNFALLDLPVFAGLFLVRIRAVSVPRLTFRRSALAAGAAVLWCAGAAPLLMSVFRSDSFSDGWRAVLLDVLVGQYATAVAGGTVVPIAITCFNFVLAALSFTLPCWWAVFGIRFGRLRAAFTDPAVRLLTAFFAIHFLFWVRYRVADQATFLLPTLFFAALLLSRVLSGVRYPRLTAVATLVVSLVVPLAAVCVGHGIVRIEENVRPSLPFRDDVVYFALPWKQNENSAQRFIEAAARELPKGTFVYADYSAVAPLGCARVIGCLPYNVRLSDPYFNGGDPGKVIAETPLREVRPFGVYRQSPILWRAIREGAFYRLESRGNSNE